MTRSITYLKFHSNLTAANGYPAGITSQPVSYILMYSYTYIEFSVRYGYAVIVDVL